MQGGKNQMSGKGGVDCRIGGFSVTDFSDQYYIGILADDSAEAVGKIISFFRVNLRLLYAGKVVFDRVLDGNDFYFRRVDFSQKRVKRGSFSGAGRTGG